MNQPKANLSGPIKQIVDLLVRGKFDEIVQLTDGIRLDADAIRDEIARYGRRLTNPPEAAFQELDAVEVENSTIPTWSVFMNLWTAEEGMSDLSIDLTVVQRGEDYTIEFDDIHVR